MPFKTYIPSKTDRARAVATQLKAEGKPVTATGVAAVLAEQGVVMSLGHCARATEKFRTVRRRRRRGAGRRVVQAADAHRLTALQPRDYASLIYAAQLIKSCGNVDKARKTLTEAALIIDPFTKS